MRLHSLRWALVAVAVSTGSFACSGVGRAEPTCVELITVEEVLSLGRKDVLVKVDNERTGSSICVWEGPQKSGAGFLVTRQTAAWFKYENASGPKASFDRKRQAYDSVVGTDPLPGLGIEARITRHERVPTVFARRAADVVYLMCGDCSRDQTITLAKLAVTP